MTSYLMTLTANSFDFDKANVEWLAKTFLPEDTDSRGGCLSSIQRMETTLKYLADPGFLTLRECSLGTLDTDWHHTYTDWHHTCCDRAVIWTGEDTIRDCIRLCLDNNIIEGIHCGGLTAMKEVLKGICCGKHVLTK